MSLYDDIVDVQVTPLNYSVPAAVHTPLPTPVAPSPSTSNAPTLPVVKPGLMPPQLMARKFALPAKKPVAPKAPSMCIFSPLRDGNSEFDSVFVSVPVPALFSPAAEQQVEKAVVTSPPSVSVKPAAIETPAVPPPPAEPKQPIDEYDPVKPNDYELINLERKRIHETERKAKEGSLVNETFVSWISDTCTQLCSCCSRKRSSDGRNAEGGSHSWICIQIVWSNHSIVVHYRV
jgi:hypothetical protein